MATRIPQKTWGKHNATEKTNNMATRIPPKHGVNTTQQRKLTIWATRIPPKPGGKHNKTEKTNNMGNTDLTKNLW